MFFPGTPNIFVPGDSVFILIEKKKGNLNKQKQVRNHQTRVF